MRSRSRVTLSLTKEMTEELDRRFGAEAKQEKGAEARRWLRLGYKIAEAAGPRVALIGERVDCVRVIMAAEEPAFQVIADLVRKVGTEKAGGNGWAGHSAHGGVGKK